MREDCAENQYTPFISLIYPGVQNRFDIPLELCGKRGKTDFKADHLDRGAAIHWHLDLTYLGTTREIHTMSLSQAPGRHKLILVDETGERLVRWFDVLAK